MLKEILSTDKLSFSSRILLVVVALVLIFSLVLFVFLPRGGEPVSYGRVRYTVLSDYGAVETLFYQKDEPLACADGLVKKRTTAFGGEWDAVLTEEKELFLLLDGKATLLSECAVDFLLAAEGGAIVYLEESGALYRQQKPDMEREMITDAFLYSDLNMLALSPHGERVCYTVQNGEEEALCLWDGEEGRVLEALCITDGVTPLAVSDDASGLYYRTAHDTALYYADGNFAPVKLTASLSQDHTRVRFNRTLSEVLFCETNAYTYFSELGAQKEKVSSGVAVPVEQSSHAEVRESAVSVYSFDTFRSGLFLVTQDKVQNLRYFKDDLQNKKLASDVLSAHLSADAKTLFVVRRWEEKHRIYQIDLSKREMQEELVASGVTDYAVSSDGNCVLYITRGNKLYRHEKDNSTLLFEGAVSVFAGPGGQIAWTTPFFEGGEVLYVLQDKEARRVAEGVEQVFFAEENLYASVKGQTLAHWCILAGGELIPLPHP